MTDLKVFVIHWSAHVALRRSVAQDEVEFVGHAKEPTELRWIVVAPSLELAMVAFKDRHRHEMRTEAYKFKQGDVEEWPLDYCLITVD